MFCQQKGSIKEGFKCFALPESLKEIFDEIAFRERLKKGAFLERALKQATFQKRYPARKGERWIHTSAILSPEASEEWRYKAHYAKVSERQYLAGVLYDRLREEFGAKHPDMFNNNVRDND